MLKGTHTMTQELAVTSFTPDQLKLITTTVAKGATPDELKLFLYRCNNLGLDPLKSGQIYFVKYGSGPGSIVVGIDGFRAKASASGKLTGIKRGVIRDEKGYCTGAWAEVYRSDWQHPAREEVARSEYDTGKAMWAKMVETMLKKVAEAAALRMAFPEQLGGVYESSEMDQAEMSRQPSIKPQQPEIGDGDTTPSKWTFGFGKWKQRSVEELYNDPSVGPDRLKSYVSFLEDSAYKSGKELSPSAKEAIQHIDQFLGAVENNMAKPFSGDVSVVPDEQDLPF